MLEGRAIIVVGAGVAGLAAATALARRGAEVTVLEQAPEIREFGAGLQISPNGMVVLRALDAVPVGVPAQAVELRNGLTSAKVLRIALNQPDRPYLFVHRGALIDTLAAAARREGVVIHTGAKVAQAAADGTVALTDGRVMQAGLILGGDGIHSRLRYAVLGTSPPARFTGQIAWRAVVAAEEDAAPIAVVAMGPGKHLVSYPLAGGFRNIVAVEERREWAGEGWHMPGDPDLLRRAFGRFTGPAADWLSRVEQVHLWGLFRHPVAEAWHQGGAVLLGDAAHPTLPFLAQGANMALEDAWSLADHLSRLPQAEALAAYQAARRPRVERIIAATEANARNYHLRWPLAGPAHLALRLGSRIAPNAAAARFEWLYGHDVTRQKIAPTSPVGKSGV